MIISTDAEKIFDKIQHRFITKTLLNRKKRELSLRAATKKVLQCVQHSRSRLSASQRTRSARLLSPRLFNTVLGVCPIETTTRQARETKGKHIRKEVVKRAFPCRPCGCMCRKYRKIKAPGTQR